MTVYRNKAIRYFILTIVCLGLAPLPAYSGLFGDSKTVSGTISAIHDNVVELDGNGIFYYPARATVKMDLTQGSAVTLRYYVSHDGKGTRKYLQWAAGINKLKDITPPEPHKNRKKM